MRQIAAESGTSLGGIYNHFSSKEEIFETVFFEYHPYREILPAIQKADGEDIEVFVRSAAEIMVSALERRPGFLNLMFIETVEFESRHLPMVFAEVLPQLQEIATEFDTLEPRLRTTDALVLLRAFIGLFLSYYLTEVSLIQSSPELVGHQASSFDEFVDIFLHGIVAM
jgi:AcrR family transcriptional regulator